MAAFSKQGAILPMLFAFFAIFNAVVASHAAHNHLHVRDPEALNGHIEETKKLLQERANNIAITGVQGTVYPRQEVRDLKRNADQWNLYLLGMERFMAKDKSDRLSYYQIAGVHGVPYVSWNNFPTPLVNDAGFCPHGQTLFGTWHRPYLAVFEQAWYQCVQEVIATFPSNQQQRWKDAASTLRIPFWDWARQPPSGESTVPTLFRDQRVSVTKPQGQVTINNPLYNYNWGTWPQEMGSGPWNSNPFTLRRPVSNPTRSNNNEVAQQMDNIRLSLRDRVYGLFMSGASFGDMSTSAIGVRTSQNGNNPDSIESVHDAIHVTVGGDSGGHMYYLDFSSFDPIFWLHHANVDRLLAMYQAVSSNTYVTPGQINRPMAQWNVGESKNSFTPLKPFTKNTNGDYFTSEDIRATSVLGYVYPETANGASRDQVVSAVNRLYGPNSSTRKTKRSLAPGYGPQTYEGRAFQQGDYHTVLSIVADKYAMAGSYEIHCWVGGNNATTNSTKPANSTSSYDFESPNYVGSYGVLGMLGSSKNASSSYPLITEGCIPLTTSLQGKQAYGELKSLAPSTVSDYLQKNLVYKVTGPNGVELSPSQVPSLHVYVKSCPVTPAKSQTELPSWGSFTVLSNVTSSMPAGAPYKPTPKDITPYPNNTLSLPWSQPEAEAGYCVTKQTINYVDESGKFLYSKSY